MKVIYRDRVYIGDYKAIDHTRKITFIKWWFVGDLLYGYINRFEVKSIAKSDIISMEV